MATLKSIKCDSFVIWQERLKKTDDGSHTIYVPKLDEHYHSINGAMTESEHIYTGAAFDYSDKEFVRVLEYGMGTGLNVLLTYLRASKAGEGFFTIPLRNILLQRQSWSY